MDPLPADLRYNPGSKPPPQGETPRGTAMNAVATAPILEDPPIDSGKPFIPEALTPLFHTP